MRNFDSYFDPPGYYDEPETEEEIAKAAADAKAEMDHFYAVEDAWWAGKCKCRCGRYIALNNLFHDGICSLCFDEGMADLDRAREADFLLQFPGYPDGYYDRLELV